MPVIDPESRFRKGLWHFAEVLKVIRLLRGPLLASLAAAALFYLPDQIRELYRITAAEGSRLEILVGICALVAMFWVFWWASFEIALRFGNRIDKTAGLARWLLTKLPAAIAALPLFACAGGLRQAQALSDYEAPDVASPWFGKAEELKDAVDGLQTAAITLACLGGILFVIAYWLQRNRKIDLEAEGRRRGFFSAIGLGVSVAIFFGIATAVLLFPVTAPQAIGTLPLLALFFVTLALVLAHLTFWYEMTGVPFLTILVLTALMFAALNWNDNHDIASVGEKFGAPAAAKDQMPSDVWASFLDWYQARPGKDQFKDTFPVYVVAAQGGGIYAAYHTAILLSRMQDYCPEFRNHLFAISSVSGGSLGAAVFASATKALAETRSEDEEDYGPASPEWPCPQMEKSTGHYFVRPSTGDHERAARQILASNFLAPLVAGTLFPDFIQRFLPWPVPAFDRARWLESAFEYSWRQADDGWQQRESEQGCEVQEQRAKQGDEIDLAGVIEADDCREQRPNPFLKANPFRESILKLWNPHGAAPALLINTTETDSGRRLVISPFEISEQSEKSEVLQFPLWNRNLDKDGSACQGIDISLSTAVSLSARFPWLTPAGTLTSDCREDDASPTSRLVDGGYFDNSGVDTALDVITQIQNGLTRRGGSLGDGPKIDIHLIVLSTGEFPKRNGYGLGDALEPIRGLLSTRVARTPIAIGRARRQLDVFRTGDSQPEGRARVEHVHEARFRNPVFTLPLGWRLSALSRDIIEMQSGRFWDCDPNLAYNQEAEEFSNADCIQRLIYHQLNDSLGGELELLNLGVKWRNDQPPSSVRPRLDHEVFFRCYQEALKMAPILPVGAAAVLQEGKTYPKLQRRQKLAIEQVLRLWDSSPQFTDDRWLAFMLAVIEYETGALPYPIDRSGGCLSEKCIDRLIKRYHWNFAAPNGKRYYHRGLIRLKYAENYQAVGNATGEPLYDNPDLLLIPEISARALFALMTNADLSPGWTLDNFTTKDGFDVSKAFAAYYGSKFYKRQVNQPAQLDKLEAIASNHISEELMIKVRVSHARFMECVLSSKASR